MEAVTDQCITAITVRQPGYRLRPCNRQPWIIVAQAGFASRCPWGGMHVKQMNFVGQCLESVGETLWNEDGAVVVLGQFYRMPLQEGWRALTQIYGYVERATVQAADKFGLSRGWYLIMQSPNGATAAGFGEVDLGEVQA